MKQLCLSHDVTAYSAPLLDICSVVSVLYCSEHLHPTPLPYSASHLSICHHFPLYEDTFNCLDVYSNVTVAKDLTDTVPFWRLLKMDLVFSDIKNYPNT